MVPLLLHFMLPPPPSVLLCRPFAAPGGDVPPKASQSNTPTLPRAGCDTALPNARLPRRQPGLFPNCMGHMPLATRWFKCTAEGPTPTSVVSLCTRIRTRSCTIICPLTNGTHRACHPHSLTRESCAGSLLREYSGCKQTTGKWYVEVSRSRLVAPLSAQASHARTHARGVPRLVSAWPAQGAPTIRSELGASAHMDWHHCINSLVPPAAMYHRRPHSRTIRASWRHHRIAAG